MKILTSLIIFYSLTIFGFQGIEIPPIEEQILIYRNIYSAYNNKHFDPQTTHIDEYRSIVPIAFSYADTLVSPDDKWLVFHFWNECQQDLNSSKMTIARYKKTIMRLALLVAKSQERGAFYYASGLLRTLQDKFAQNIFSLDYDANALNSGFINNPNMLEVHPYPFCFEALLFHPKGEFSFDNYLSSLLDPDITLSLSVFPASGDGPHNNFLKSSAGFLLHDLAHWAIFVEKFAQSDWLAIKSGLWDFYQENTREEDKSLLFILTHELPQHLDREEPIPSNASLVLERWFALANKYLEKAISYAAPREMHTPKFIESGDVYWVFWEDKCDGCYALGLKVNESFISLPLYYNLNFKMSPHPHGTFFTIENAKIVSLDDDEELDTKINEHLPGKTRDDFITKLVHAQFAYQHSALSHTFFYDVLFYDLISLINLAVGHEKLPIGSETTTIANAFNELSETVLQRLKK